jgi:hypothetical protein
MPLQFSSELSSGFWTHNTYSEHMDKHYTAIGEVRAIQATLVSYPQK